MSPLRRRGPSPTPVSHIGASARTVSRRLGPGSEPLLDSGPRRARAWLPVLVVAASVLLVAGGLAAIVAFSGPARLGAWASSPEQGSHSPLEPVELDGGAAADEPAP